jgi:hypothetical protein
LRLFNVGTLAGVEGGKVAKLRGSCSSKTGLGGVGSRRLPRLPRVRAVGLATLVIGTLGGKEATAEVRRRREHT